MRGRMPFPDPTLPIVIVLFLFSGLVPTCLRIFSDREVRDESEEGSHEEVFAVEGK